MWIKSFITKKTKRPAEISGTEWRLIKKQVISMIIASVAYFYPGEAKPEGKDAQSIDNLQQVDDSDKENKESFQLLESFFEGKELPEGKHVLGLLDTYLDTLPKEKLENLKKESASEEEKKDNNAIIDLCRKALGKVNLKELIFISDSDGKKNYIIHSEINSLLSITANPFLPKDLQLEFYNTFENFVLTSIKDGSYSLGRKNGLFIPAAYYLTGKFPFFAGGYLVLMQRDHFRISKPFYDQKKEYKADPEIVAKVEQLNKSILNGDVLDRIDFGLIGSLFMKLRKAINHATEEKSWPQIAFFTSIYMISLPFTLPDYLLGRAVFGLTDYFNGGKV